MFKRIYWWNWCIPRVGNAAKSLPVCSCCQRIIQDEEPYFVLIFPFGLSKLYACQRYGTDCRDHVRNLWQYS